MKSRSWAPFYDYQLFNDRRYLESLIEMKKHNYSPYTIFGYETAIAQKEWMKEHDIQPVFAGTYIPNIHDQWKEENRKEKKWNEQRNRKVDHSGLFSLYMYFRDYLYFIPLLLFLILVGAGFSGERGKRPTLHLLGDIADHEAVPFPWESAFQFHRCNRECGWRVPVCCARRNGVQPVRRLDVSGAALS